MVYLTFIIFVFVQDIYSSNTICYRSVRQTPQCSELAAVSKIVQSITDVSKFQQPGKEIVYLFCCHIFISFLISQYN